MKLCTVCNIEKPLSDFSPDKRISSGLQSRCKPCYAKIMRDRRALDPTAHRESVRKSVQKNYDAKISRNRKYRAENPQKVQKWKRQDRLNNKSRVLADNAKRRALLGGETSVEIEQLYALRDFFQAMSLGDLFHVDHKIPLSRGGKHVFENLQVIPAIDNLRKGAT